MPTILGYLGGGLLDARVLIETHGQPETIGAWLTLAIGVVWMAQGRWTKQVNMSNAPNPVAEHMVKSTP
jgi:hypothetical protein